MAPEPEFTVLGAAVRRHAAVPALDFDVHVTEPTRPAGARDRAERADHDRAGARAYDAETRERLVELFGPPERWATTTRSLVWHQADVLVPAFTGSTTFRVPVPCSFDLEMAAAKYFYGSPDGEVPLAFNFNGTVHYRGDDGRLQMSLVPWCCSAEFRFPARSGASGGSSTTTRARGGSRSTRTRCGRCCAEKARRGAADDRRGVAELLKDAGA